MDDRLIRHDLTDEEWQRVLDLLEFFCAVGRICQHVQRLR